VPTNALNNNKKLTLPFKKCNIKLVIKTKHTVQKNDYSLPIPQN
jgi:hypothetical protein